MTLPAHAPWQLQGDCLVALVPRPRAGPLPAGLVALPGPALVIASRFADSPVGPYLELAVAEPARLGLRPGLCLTTLVVTSADARVGGVVNWGFPKELGTLEWSPAGEGARVVWKEREISVEGSPSGRRALPLLVPMRAVQRRADGPVVVPGRVRGWARPCRVTVDVAPDDPLARLAGRHHGGHVHGLRLVVDPARHPIGLASTLRAPLRPPEPALSGPGRLVAAGKVAPPMGV